MKITKIYKVCKLDLRGGILDIILTIKKMKISGSLVDE